MNQRTGLTTEEVLVTIIQPSRGRSAFNLRELWKYHELLYFLTYTDYVRRVVWQEHGPERI